jgi:hypothetical protein
LLRENKSFNSDKSENQTEKLTKNLELESRHLEITREELNYLNSRLMSSRQILAKEKEDRGIKSDRPATGKKKVVIIPPN